MDAQVTQKMDAPVTLAGRVAVITGSTSGIGLGIARAFAAAGADILLNGFGKPEEIEVVRAAIETDHRVAVAYSAADLIDPAGPRDLIRGALDTFGRVDILVNNAGIQHVAPIEDFPAERWDSILALNLSAAFHAIRAAFPGMKARGFGRIVNIASAHALVASPFKSAYVAAKHGVLGLTKVVALEGAEHDITANAICPGYVWTPLVENQIAATATARGIRREAVIRDVLLAAQPTRRFAEIDEIGALAVFLCGPGGRSITGAALPVDGGWTAH